MNGYHPMPHLTSSKGFTLIEMMMVMVIIGLLASVAIPKYEGYIEQARIARCIAEIRYLERDIQAYYVANEKYPDSIGDLGLTIQNMLDPWGNPYKYFLIAGTKWVSNRGDGTTYYARGGRSGDTFYAREIWRLDFVAAAVDREGGFWSGSWFISTAYAAKGGTPGPPPPSPPPPPPPPPPPSDDKDKDKGGGNDKDKGGGNDDEQKKPRKDRFLKPITSDYDLYSMGVDGKTKENLNSKESRDDIIRASEGAYVGLAENF